MEQSQLIIDLSAMIEWKINNRNQLAKQRPRPDGIIAIIDREIDILEKIESYLPALENSFARKLIEGNRKSFEEGRKAGILECRTGRNHSQYFLTA